jgi:ribosomal protein S18 acetylase RimI-like enzyme
MQIKIRRFRPSDAEECGKIAAENVIRLFYDIHAPIAAWDYVEHLFPSNFPKLYKRKEFFVVEGNGKIIGYASFHKLKKKGKIRGHISHVFIKYGLRGKGVGTKLMKFIENKIKQKLKLDTACLYAACIKPTIKFYEKLGYEKKGKIIHAGPKYIKKKDRTRAVYMEKNLS